MDDIENRVKLIVAEQLCIEVDEVDEVNELSELGADSLDEVEIIMALEAEFDVDIPDVHIGECRTVGDFIRILKDSHSP